MNVLSLRRGLVLVPLFGLVACAGAAPAPSLPKTAEAPTTAATGPSSTTAAPECFVTVVRNAPKTPVTEVGTGRYEGPKKGPGQVTIEMGKSAPWKGPITHPNELGSVLEQHCTEGAVLLAWPKAMPKGDNVTIEFVVAKRSADEKADLDVICNAESRMAALEGADPSQKAALARAFMEENVSSPRFAKWLRETDKKLEAADDVSKVSVRKARAAELADMATKAGTACPYAKTWGG